MKFGFWFGRRSELTLAYRPAVPRPWGVEGVAHVIGPKAISKEALYGVLDPNTREWNN